MKDDRDPIKLYQAIFDAQLKYGCTIVQAADAVEAWRDQGYDACSTIVSAPPSGFVASAPGLEVAPQNGAQRLDGGSETGVEFVD